MGCGGKSTVSTAGRKNLISFGIDQFVSKFFRHRECERVTDDLVVFEVRFTGATFKNRGYPWRFCDGFCGFFVYVSVELLLVYWFVNTVLWKGHFVVIKMRSTATVVRPFVCLPDRCSNFNIC